MNAHTLGLILLALVFSLSTEITGQFPLRFSGIGASPYQGRVEVLHNGIWGTVCDDKFGTEEAEVVCKMQGLQGGTVMPSGTFGFGQGQIWIDDLVCDGTERHLGQCQFCAWGVTNCKHEEDVGVQCQTPSTGAPPTVQPNNCSTTPAAPQQWDVRIVGPNNQKGLGFVEVYYNNQWSAVCDDLWGTNDARVICNMLCFDPVIARAGSVIEINYVRPNVSSTFALDDVVCQGNENSLRDCRFTTGAAIDCLAPYEYASVTCTNLNNSAPAPPTPTLDCSDGHIKASFSRKDDRYLEEKFLWIFNQTSGPCHPVKATDANFVSISIPFDECGTLTTSNESHIIYTNVIQYEYNSTNGNSLCGNSDYNSTKANIICVSYRIEISCEFPRDLYAYKEMRPLIESAAHNAPGMYRIRMDFFRNNSFIRPVSNYPLNLTLGEWLYVSLTLENVDQNLKVIVPECVATPSTSYTDPTNHPLFKNKCQCDPTLAFFPWNATSSGFRYKACKFAQFELVYLHCKAFVCLLSEKTAECDRSCNSTIAGRRRRDVMTQPTYTKQIYHIESPAMYIYKKDNSDSVMKEWNYNASSTMPPLTTTNLKSDSTASQSQIRTTHIIPKSTTTVRTVSELRETKNPESTLSKTTMSRQKTEQKITSHETEATSREPIPSEALTTISKRSTTEQKLTTSVSEKKSQKTTPKKEALIHNLTGTQKPTPKKQTPTHNLTGTQKPTPKEQIPTYNLTGTQKPTPNKQTPTYYLTGTQKPELILQNQIESFMNPTSTTKYISEQTTTAQKPTTTSMKSTGTQKQATTQKSITTKKAILNPSPTAADKIEKVADTPKSQNMKSRVIKNKFSDYPVSPVVSRKRKISNTNSCQKSFDSLRFVLYQSVLLLAFLHCSFG